MPIPRALSSITLAVLLLLSMAYLLLETHFLKYRVANRFATISGDQSRNTQTTEPQTAYVSCGTYLD